MCAFPGESKYSIHSHLRGKCDELDKLTKIVSGQAEQIKDLQNKLHLLARKQRKCFKWVESHWEIVNDEQK